jgi:hypothetical protein
MLPTMFVQEGNIHQSPRPFQYITKKSEEEGQQSSKYSNNLSMNQKSFKGSGCPEYLQQQLYIIFGINRTLKLHFNVCLKS